MMYDLPSFKYFCELRRLKINLSILDFSKNLSENLKIFLNGYIKYFEYGPYPITLVLKYFFNSSSIPLTNEHLTLLFLIERQ